MSKIKEILIGTNNVGKYKEICDLLPKKLIKHYPKNLEFLHQKKQVKIIKRIQY